jgi:two-component system cell cycle sensor histidine kinase/response regulator CckA
MRDTGNQGRYEASRNSSIPEEIHRFLFEEAADGIFITDPQGRLVSVNPRGTELTGYPHGELLGLTLTDLIPPENLARDPMRLDEPRQGKTVLKDRRIRRKDGHLLPVEISVHRLPGGNLLGLVRDVTERKKAEEAFRARENLISSVFRAAPVGIGVVSNRILLAVNDRICEMVGCRQEDLVGKSARVFYPSDAEFEYVGAEKYRQIVETGTGTVETRWQCKDGRIIDVLLSSTPVNPLDMAGGVTFSALDIFDRKRAEEALRASETFLQTIIDNSPISMWVSDGRGTLIRMNPACRELLQVTDEELVGKYNVLEDNIVEQQGAMPLVKRVFEKGESVRFTLRYDSAQLRSVRLEKTAQLVLEVTISPVLDIRGQVVHAIIQHLDITERTRTEETLRESEERFSSFMRHLPGFAFVKDHDRRVLYVNELFEVAFGLPLPEWLGKTNDEIWPGEVGEKIRRDDEAVLASGQARAIVEDVPTRGQLRTYRTIKFPIPRPDGPPWLGGMSVDITELKQAEAEKDQFQAQLLQAQKMESVGRLAGGVAHDFNNMLSAIIGHADLAMMQCTPADPIHPNLKAIQNAAQRSADLTRQLLAFARKQTVAPKVLDLNDTVAGMLKMLLRLIGEDIDLVWMPGTGLWPVKLDPSQIDQLLANLCVNARDAIAGVGKITIETENIAFDEDYCAVHPGFPYGEYVLLAVSDDGDGMDQEVLNHLFEPFFTTKVVGQGTGLGLATVYGIVRQNDGFINVHSEPGKGTTFKIYLPRFAGEALEPTAETPAETPQGRGETVLLVEDEAAILNVGRGMLERLGYTVLTAATPGEALRQAKAHAAEIQLLITDVVMPEMNGRDLAKLISDLKPGLKYLFISGYTANVIAHRGVLDKGLFFLQKPFSMKDLAFKVRQALERE